MIPYDLLVGPTRNGLASASQDELVAKARSWTHERPGGVWLQLASSRLCTLISSSLGVHWTRYLSSSGLPSLVYVRPTSKRGCKTVPALMSAASRLKKKNTHHHIA